MLRSNKEDDICITNVHTSDKHFIMNNNNWFKEQQHIK